MGWGPVECQPHGPSTTSHAHGLLMWALLGPTNKPARMSTSVCLTPHVLEVYNHKVNHDMHKELNMQEQVLQYAALQYISYCNDARYKDKWVPAVKHFWAEVVKPFGSQTLHNLDPSHLLGTAMCPNCGAKIPDYKVNKHIAFVCAASFQGIESCSQYEKRRQR